MNELWNELISMENLLCAYGLARKGKRSKSAPAAFDFHMEENLFDLRSELMDGTYRPGKYQNFWIHDPKKRLISAAPFRDRIVHHAVHRISGPIFERSFIYDTYANRVGKGTLAAIDRCSSFLRRYQYVMPMDLEQYFFAVDHEILMKEIGQKISDEKFNGLCRKILESGLGVQNGLYKMKYFPGDDLFSQFRPRGLPIGNMTSQFWANVYLNRFDQWVKRSLRVPGYIRYVDDMLFFSDDKAELFLWKGLIIQKLADLRLTIHENSAQTRPAETGVPFLGFQIFPDHRTLKRRKVVHTKRKLLRLMEEYKLGRISSEKMYASLQSWMSHAAHGDSFHLRCDMCRQLGVGWKVDAVNGGIPFIHKSI